MSGAMAQLNDGLQGPGGRGDGEAILALRRVGLVLDVAQRVGNAVYLQAQGLIGRTQ